MSKCKNCKHEIEFLRFDNPAAKMLGGWHHSKEKFSSGFMICGENGCGCTNPELDKGEEK